MEKNEKILDLGCGLSPHKDSTILIDTNDVIKREFSDKTTIIHDLNKLPFPIEDCTIDKIYAFQLIEHLNISIYDFFKECLRILKPDGIIELCLPNCYHYRARWLILTGRYILDGSYHPFHYKFLKPSYVYNVMRHLGFSPKYIPTTTFLRPLEYIFPDLFARGIYIKARKRR